MDEAASALLWSWELNEGVPRARIREIMKAWSAASVAGDRLSPVEDIMALGAVRSVRVVSQDQLGSVTCFRQRTRDATTRPRTIRASPRT
jgi:hypothetical protein